VPDITTDGTAGAVAPPGRTPRLTPADAEELAAFFLEQAQGLFRFIYRLTRGDTLLAEDIVQETFITAARRWGRVREMDRRNAGAWLRKVAANKAVDHWRREHREVPASADELLDSASGPDPAATAISNDLAHRAADVVKRMPSTRGEVLSLSLSGLAPREIAGKLGLHDATVRSHLRYARQQIRALLEEFPEAEVSLHAGRP
jgi:RNA polymerase sigma-70 factor, ECF subfamily